MNWPFSCASDGSSSSSSSEGGPVQETQVDGARWRRRERGERGAHRLDWLRLDLFVVRRLVAVGGGDCGWLACWLVGWLAGACGVELDRVIGEAGRGGASEKRSGARPSLEAGLCGVFCFCFGLRFALCGRSVGPV